MIESCEITRNHLQITLLLKAFSLCVTLLAAEAVIMLDLILRST